MTEPAVCPTCKSPIPPDSPEGACPRCMLAAGLGAGLPAVPSAAEVEAKLPAFEVLSLLGRGGMGVVYKARQKALDRVVALKVLPAEAASAPGFAERFAREAKAMARLQHPNIVAVHDFGESDGLFWLVMEYVDGVNVREAMRAGRITPKEALAIVPQICDALQYAHDRGVVHRDVKPENVLMGRDGRVRVADFGLAKLMEAGAADRTLTGAGQVMGTPHYMAPEQVEHPSDVDHRADIYSLGVVFYEMLTGELPLGRFAAPSARAAIDVRLDEVVLRSLERVRARRWQRADHVSTQIEAIASGRAGPVPAARGPSEPAPPVSVLALFGATTVAVASAVYYAEVVEISRLPWNLFVPPVGSAPVHPMGEVILVVVFVTFLIGWVASIVAWVRVRRSRGALSGLWLAAIGMIVPLSPAMAFLIVPIVVWRERRELREARMWRLREREFAKRGGSP
jgi:predicted Ser/Thr protein kinase